MGITRIHEGNETVLWKEKFTGYPPWLPIHNSLTPVTPKNKSIV